MNGLERMDAKLKPVIIIVIAFVLLISSITPYVNADPLQIIQECTNNVITLEISDSEGPVKNVSVYIYREIGLREYEGKVVTDENGKAKITNTSRTNAAKVTKGGYNDTLIFLECLPPKTNVISEPTVQKIPDIPTHVPLEGIPDWVKNTVGWWSEGQLKDEEFVNSVGFLIKNGVIKLSKTESIDGISPNMIFDLPSNGALELIFDGSVVPVPVSPVFLELTFPDGTISQREQMIGAGGKYSFLVKFFDDAELGIYNVQLFFNNKLIKSESFKLEKFVPKHTTIPDWVKHNAGWWAHDKIGEESFISGIQYLVNNEIIILETNDVDRSYEKNIPSSKYKETHIDGFPDPLKTPEYYFERYYGEIEYQNWFDKQFPKTTIGDILGVTLSPNDIVEKIIPNYAYSSMIGIEKLDNISVNSDNSAFVSYSTKYGNSIISDFSKFNYRITQTPSPDNALLGFQTPNVGNSNSQFVDGGGMFEDFGFHSSTLVNDYEIKYKSLEYPNMYLFSDKAFCVGLKTNIIQCAYDKYFILLSNDKISSENNNFDSISIILLDKTFQNISKFEHKNYNSSISSNISTWENYSFDDLIQDANIDIIQNEDVAVEGAVTQLENEGFSGLYCTQTEYGSVKMTGQYTNGPDSYSTIYFTLGITDHQDRIVATGLGSVSNIGPYQTKIFDASASWEGNYKECVIEIDVVYP